jgi:maltose O-acetyltransferase
MFNTAKRKLARRIKNFIEYHTKLEPASMESFIEHMRSHGIKIGQRVAIWECKFDGVYPWLITIGNDCTLSGAEILTHDDSAVLHIGRRQVGPVRIGNGVFVGRGSIILPGVTIGSNSIIAAGSVVTKDVPEGAVVAGNPAQVITHVDDVCRRKEGSGRLIPFDFSSNIMSRDENEQSSQLVHAWKQSGFKKWL